MENVDLEIREDALLEIAKKAKAAGCKVWLNAAPAKKINSAFFSLVDICIVNRVEAEFYNFINSNKNHKQTTKTIPKQYKKSKIKIRKKIINVGPLGSPGGTLGGPRFFSNIFET